VARAIDMGIVATICLILNMSCINGDAALSLFRSAIYIAIILGFCLSMRQMVATMPMSIALATLIM
jgi:hypothetical protein